MFASYFKSVYSDNHNYNYNLNDIKVDKLQNINISQKDIFEAVKGLKSSSTNGPDMIKPVIVVNCIDSLIQPLLILFQFILETGVYPT